MKFERFHPLGLRPLLVVGVDRISDACFAGQENFLCLYRAARLLRFVDEEMKEKQTRMAICQFECRAAAVVVVVDVVGE